METKKLISSVLLTLCVAGWVFPAAAQTLDTGILGTVTDPGSAVVTNATVRVTNPDTGFTRLVQTAQDGKYEVRYLVPGTYTVEVQAARFRTERRTNVVIQINQQARTDFQMQLGDVQQTVEVTGAPPMLQTENATLGEVVATERIVNLPLNGRSFAQLSVLTPGVRVYEPSQFTSSTDGSRIIANGARDSWMQVNITNPSPRFVIPDWCVSPLSSEEYKLGSPEDVAKMSFHREPPPDPPRQPEARAERIPTRCPGPMA